MNTTKNCKEKIQEIKKMCSGKTEGLKTSFKVSEVWTNLGEVHSTVRFAIIEKSPRSRDHGSEVQRKG